MVRVLYMPAATALGIEVVGRIGRADRKHVNTEIERQLKTHSRARLLIDVPGGDDLSVVEASEMDASIGPRRARPSRLAAIAASWRLSVRFRRRLERQAIVANGRLVKAYAGLVNLLFRRMEVRCFPRTSRDLAVHWLGVNDRAMVPVDAGGRTAAGIGGADSRGVAKPRAAIEAGKPDRRGERIITIRRDLAAYDHIAPGT